MSKLSLFISLLIFTVSLSTNAQSWRVNNVPGVDADFTTLSQAVSSANVKNGDTIYLESSPNNYSGSVTINKKLHILGTGYFLEDTANHYTQWNKNSAYQSGSVTFAPGSSGSVLSGLELSTIYVNDTSVILERNYMRSTIYLAYAQNSNAGKCIIRQNYFVGSIYAYSATGTAKDVLIHNNIIRGSITSENNLDGFTAYIVNNTFPYYNSIQVANCIFQNNIFFNPYFSNYASSNVYYNNIVNNTAIASENNNLQNVNFNDLFQNWNNGNTNPSDGFSHDGKFKLKPGSAAVNAGSLNGQVVDCGAFGGPAPYVLSGMPPIPSIYKLTMPSQVNSGSSTMTISIGAAAH